MLERSLNIFSSFPLLFKVIPTLKYDGDFDVKICKHFQLIDLVVDSLFARSLRSNKKRDDLNSAQRYKQV